LLVQIALQWVDVLAVCWTCSWVCHCVSTSNTASQSQWFVSLGWSVGGRRSGSRQPGSVWDSLYVLHCLSSMVEPAAVKMHPPRTPRFNAPCTKRTPSAGCW